MKLSFKAAMFIMLFSIVSVLTVKPAFAAELDGNWFFTLDTEGGVREISATLKLEGEKVTGKWDEFDVQGTFSGRNLDLDFTIDVDEVQTEGNLRIAGKLEKGKLVGSLEFDQYAGPFEPSHLD